MAVKYRPFTADTGLRLGMVATYPLGLGVGSMQFDGGRSAIVYRRSDGAVGTLQKSEVWETIIPTAAEFVVGEISSDGRAYMVDTTARPAVIKLPLSPVEGHVLTFCDAVSNFALNTMTINPNGKKILGKVASVVVNRSGATVVLKWTGETYGWMISYSSNPMTLIDEGDENALVYALLFGG